MRRLVTSIGQQILALWDAQIATDCILEDPHIMSRALPTRQHIYVPAVKIDNSTNVEADVSVAVPVDRVILHICSAREE